MPAPVPVTPLTSPRPTPKSELTYAPARPAGLSSLIDHLGPGYVVVKLVPPPLWLETLRLVGLTVIAAFFLVAPGFGHQMLRALERGGGPPVSEWSLLVVLGLFLTGFTISAAAAVGQARRLLRRLRRAEAAVAAGSITFRRPEELPDAPDAHTVLRVTVEAPIGVATAFLRVETTTGRVLPLLRGHSVTALEKLADDLRKHLLAPRSPRPKAREVSS
jgi:hypothetical protein